MNILSYIPRNLITAVILGNCIILKSATGQSWTSIIVKNVTVLGPQITPDVTNVSRDGGYSALINGNIVWLYDDTECIGYAGDQLSFVSNTAAYANQPNTNARNVQDFGVVMVGIDKAGRNQYAILADTTVGTGGWIPFQPDELDFNKANEGKERVAIWPGTSPTPISISQAFMFAPLVYVDNHPQDPSKEYQPRGMTLITITAPNSGPIATRQGDLIIPGTEVAFGGFSTLLGFPSTEGSDTNSNDRDVYLIGITDGGLQLSRVTLNQITSYSKYSFFDPESLSFSNESPNLNVTDGTNIYLPGSFSSGNIFYSPYFSTYLMVYFNKHVDSTFYIRYLDLDQPVQQNDSTWARGGKLGVGIQAEDAEALVKYSWSSEQKLYVSPTGAGGFNYAGISHPEYFNRQYFAQSLYPGGVHAKQRQNDWYGADLVTEANAKGDGRHLMLSWTSQVHGGMDNGIYQIYLAMVEFDDVPVSPQPSGTKGPNPSSTIAPGKPSKTPQNMIPGDASTVNAFWNVETGLWIFISWLGILGAVMIM